MVNFYCLLFKLSSWGNAIHYDRFHLHYSVTVQKYLLPPRGIYVWQYLVWCDCWIVSECVGKQYVLPFPSATKGFPFFVHVIVAAGFASAATHVPTLVKQKMEQNKEKSIKKITKSKQQKQNAEGLCYITLYYYYQVDFTLNRIIMEQMLHKMWAQILLLADSL